MRRREPKPSAWTQQLGPRDALIGLGVIACFILVLAPIVHNELERDATKQAQLAVRNLAGALPLIADLPSSDQVLLAGDGPMPHVAGGASTQPLGSALKPPRRVGRDPWGNAYLVLRFDPSSPEDLWVLSAGPDGQVQTTRNSRQPKGDDVGLRVRVPTAPGRN